MKVTKQLVVSLISGTILGIVCILGVSFREPNTLSHVYLFAFWFNRFLMGLVFGLVHIKGHLYNKIVKGVILGLLISFAFYSATDFYDTIGFFVGGLYGAIIVVLNQWLAFRYDKQYESQ